MSDLTGTAEETTGYLIESKIVPIDSVRPNDWNLNEMEDSVYQFLKQNIKKRGFTDAILVTKEGTIIDGEHRWRAMKEVGATEIEVKVLDLTDEEAKAETTNRSLLRGTMNQEKLALILVEITKNKAAEEVEAMVAMRHKEVERIIAKHQAAREPCDSGGSGPGSAFKEVETTLQYGDMVEMGDHRLLCGDSSSMSDVLRLFGGRQATLCVTSPPYFNQRDYSTWDTYQDYLGFIDNVILCLREVMRSGESIVCWNIGSAEKDHEFIPADHYFQFRKAGFEWLDWIVWQKDCAQWNNRRSQHIDQGLYIPAIRWESICVFGRGSRPHFEMTDLMTVKGWQENLWLITEVKGVEQRAVGHPAMFPMEIPHRCILSYTQRNQIVFDPFSGSGQTLLAAEQDGRTCYAMELDPKFVEIAVQRWEQATGRVRNVVPAGEVSDP